MQAAVSIVDTFNRSVSPGSWGVTDTGQTWLNENVHASVVPGEGTINVQVGAAYRTHYIDLSAEGIGRQGASSTLARVRWSSSTTNPTTEFGLTLNQTAADTFYFCSVNDNYDEIILGVYIGGVRWVLNQSYFLVHQDVDYWIRYEVSNAGSYTRVKIWASGTAEPGTWNVTSLTWTGAYPPGVGNCGVYYRGSYASYTIKLSAFYYYTGEDTEAGLPVIDSFERTGVNGFGVSDDKKALWQGTVALDPDVYIRTGKGLTTDPGDGYGEVTIDESVSRFGLIGPRRSSGAEVYTEFSINSAAGNTQFYVGVRGRLNPADGVPLPEGYGLRIASGATTVDIRKCVGGTWGSALATSTAFTALVSNTVYSVRFQVTGSGTSTIIRGRIWVRGTGEPGTWNVTYSDVSSPITHSGSSWFELAQSVATARVLRIYKWDYQLPTSTVPGTQTTTTSVTTTSSTDTSLTMSANFTGDTSGMNNSISVQYRLASSSEWLTSNITLGTRVAGSWPFTITDLTPNTSYQIEVTYDDVDGISGTNPIRVTVSTPQNRIIPGTASIMSLSETSAVIRATMSGDANLSGQTTVERRVVSTTNYLIRDPMDSLDNVELTLHTPEVGSGWTKRSGVDMLLMQSYTYPDAGTAGRTSLYTANDAPTGTSYEVSANVRFDSFQSSIGLIIRYQTVSGDHYVARYKDAAWQIVRVSGGVETIHMTTPVTLDLDHVYNLTFSSTTEYKAFLVDGQEVGRTTNNTIGAAGLGGFTVTASADAVVPYDVPTIGLFTLNERITGVGTWTNSLSLINSGAGYSDFTHSGLTADTVYEVRVTWADAADGGPFGGNPVQILSFMTPGQAVNLTTITVAPQYTTAVVTVAYDFDSNNNSSIDLQFRSSMETIWTTVPSTSITVSRTIPKVFTGVLVGLRPGVSYDVIATANDPNGVKDGGNASLTTKFTTLSNRTSELTLDKQYNWKVFDEQDQYVGTWKDANVPEFTWHTTTGLGDCSVELSRPFASVNNIAHDLNMMYRVDVFATAPNSDGISRNLLLDPGANLGMWTLGTTAEAQTTSGPDGGYAIRILAPTDTPDYSLSENVFLNTDSPLVFTAIAKAQKGKLRVEMRAYNSLEEQIAVSSTFATTVGSEWQKLRFSYTPPRGATYIRVAISNDGAGTMYLAHPFLSQTEQLVYRGYIQEYTAEVDESGERVSVELYSISTMLAKDYVEWLQFMSPPPAEDAAEGKPNNQSTDPSFMLMRLIDLASQQNPRFHLSYTPTSVQLTNTINDFTFEDMTFQSAFEAILDLSPPGWTILIDPYGVVSFFGPEQARTHRLRLGVEVLSMKKSPNVRDVINYVVVYGKQVEGQVDPEDNVKIKYIAFDQESINKHGRRVHIERNSGIETDRAAEIVAEGRLAEFSQATESMEIEVLDQNSLSLSPNQTLRGYPIEQILPGDYIYVTDPVALPENSYWDDFVWDQDAWDGDIYRETLTTALPIKSIKYRGDAIEIDLADKPQSVTKAFGRMWRYLQKQEREDRLGIIKE